MASLLDIPLKKKKSTVGTFFTPENTIISKINKNLVNVFKYSRENAKNISRSFKNLPNIADRSALFIAGAYALIDGQHNENRSLSLVDFESTVVYADMHLERIMQVDTVNFEVRSQSGMFRGITNFIQSDLRFTYRDLIFNNSDIAREIKQAKADTPEFIKQKIVKIEMMQELYRYVLLLLINKIYHM